MQQFKESHPINKQGKRISNYVFIRPLGQGNFGTVYLGKNVNTHMLVAIKCILISRFQDHQGMVGQLVKNEKNALMRLNHHNVVKILEYIESLNQAYLVMEYCNGGDLQTHWERQDRKFEEEQAISYFRQIVSGMKALHEKSIIHRDLKLANILIHREEGKIQEIVKIADLGFCHIFEHDESQVDLNLGSLGTKAPEIVLQQKYGIIADMFSIGAIFYQMLMGKIPFPSFSEFQFLRESQLNNPPKMDKLNPEIQELLTKMLKFDSKQRLKWSELFSHPLINQEQTIYLEIEKLQPQQLWDASYLFYYDKDLLKNDSIDNEIFTKKWEVQFFRQTQFFIHRVYHNNKNLAIFPGFMMTKLIFIENNNLLQKVKQLDTSNLAIKQLLTQINEDQIAIECCLEYEKNTAKTNLKKLKKYVKQDWIDEIFTNEIVNFTTNLIECLNQYQKQLEDELEKDKNIAQKCNQELSILKDNSTLKSQSTSNENLQQFDLNQNDCELKNKSKEECKKKLMEFKLKELLIVFIQKEVEIVAGKKVTFHYMETLDNLQKQFLRDIYKTI